MPDGDRFERRLSKGWGKSYRLAKGNAPIYLIVDALIGSIANDFRNGFVRPETIAEIISEVDSSLLPHIDLEGNCHFVGYYEGYRQLCDKLQEIEFSNIELPMTKLIIKAAQSIYISNKDKQNIDIEDIQNQLSEKFILMVIDNKFLSRVREGLMKDNNRTGLEQSEYEKQLFEAIRPQARKLVKSMLQAHDLKAVRAPKRLTKRKEWTLEQLNKPLLEN